MDACCSPARSHEDAIPLDNEEALTLLTLNEYGIKVLFSLQVIIFGLWLATDVTPGFARYDGTGANAVTHGSWWYVVEFLAIVFQGYMFGFGLKITRSNKLELGMDRMLNYLIFVCVILFGAAAANIAHLVLIMFEVTTCNSTLCTGNWGIMITFIVFLYVLPCVKAFQIYRVLTYRSNLIYALTRVDNQFEVAARKAEEGESDTATTPFLAKVRGGGSNRKGK